MLSGTRVLDRADGDQVVLGVLEGDTQVLVGVDGERPAYRVSARSNPPRLVVDEAETTP